MKKGKRPGRPAWQNCPVNDQLPAPPARRTSARARLIVLAAVVIVVVGVVVWFVVRGNQSAGSPAAVGPIAMPGHQVCADHVQINVTTDAQMNRIATAVLTDPQVGKVYTETQQQAFQHYQQEFADQPDLLALARPGVLPASVVVVPVGGVDVHSLADRFRGEFEAKEVDAVTRADSTRALASIGETAPAAPCPASGEFSSH